MKFILMMISAGLISAGAPARAAMYQGNVKESRFGAGIDSVKVTLKSTSTTTYSDSSGAFAILSTGILSTSRSNPEILWVSKSRLLTWSAVTGPVSVIIADASGRTINRYRISAAGDAGRYQVPTLRPGIYFASVRAMGRKLAWRWFERGGFEGGPGPSLPESRDRAFPLAARIVSAAGGASAQSAAPADTLIFERKGFLTGKQAVSGSESALDLKLARQPIKVLIVDGMSNHSWKQTTKIVRAVYALGGYFSVDVTTAPAISTPSAWQAWQPDFKNYEVVMMNYNSGDAAGSLGWPRDKQILLEDYVKGGGGLYVLHAANNSFPEWPGYNDMIATGWRKKDFGFALKVEASGAVTRIPAGTGGGTTHGNRADAPIRLLERHPIHKGFPAVYLSSSLEIYQYARGPAGNCKVLSYAYDGPSSGNSKLNWPIEILVGYGKGEVYNATPGHVWAGETLPDAIRDVSFQTTLIRATEWLARKEILYPVPVEFNTETKVVYRDLVLE